jgi:hypothetical protein
MRTTKMRRKLSLLFITLAAMIAIPAVAALADNVQNNVVAGGNDTITTSSSTTINYEIKNTSAGGSGFSGCDPADGSTLTLTINKPAAVTASPGSLTFNACDVPKSVQFSSSTKGDYNITVTATDTHGNYNVNSAAFTLHVTDPPPPTNTEPKLSLPSNQTAEATGAGGAAVSYNATATDEEDGSLTPTCSPASGSTFQLGSTQVNCSVTDSGGLSASGFFTVTVVDTTAPTLNLPADITEEATSADGAAVSYSASASDIVDGNVAVNCSPSSGSTFALGTTPVNCSATDAHGNTANGSFNVTVEDTTAPTLSLPANITEEATGPNGAAVTYSASASDLVDGAITPNCSPVSGSTFALGTKQVDCSATDAAGNKASGSFNVTVQDTTAPALNLPSNITKQATSNSQAQVSYSASASDLVDGAITPNCSPASGTNFPAGTTTVNCSATDAAGNKATGSFTVTVNYGFSGFRSPVDNLPTVNSVKAGSAVPIKFSLSGNQGQNIFASGFPKATVSACDSGAAVDSIEETVTAGSSSLSYDATIDQYNYVWKTDKAWAGKCIQLEVKFADGSSKFAKFKMLK